MSMSKIELNCISLNGNSLNSVGEGKIGGIRLGKNEILLMYDVTDITNKTPLVYDNYDYIKSQVDSMNIDGKDVEYTPTYQFESIGLHIVRLKFKQVDVLLRCCYGISNLVYADLSKIIIGNGAYDNCFSEAFNGCVNLRELHFPNRNYNKFSDIASILYECNNLKKITGLQKWDTAKLVNLYASFSGLKVIEELDLTKWDVTNVTNMGYLFRNWQNVVKLDLSTWDIGNVTNLTDIFRNANLKQFSPFKNWKRENISFVISYQYWLIPPIVVHQLIERSASVADGAEQRTLTLGYDIQRNWMASEYYDADIAMANEKLITIA